MEPAAIEVSPIMQDALEALPDGFMICEADGKPIVANSVSRRRFPTFYAALDCGLDFKGAIAVSVAAAWPGASREQIEQVTAGLTSKFQTGEPYETPTEDGCIVRVSFRSMPHGRKAATSVDITELRAKEKELRRAHEAAVESENLALAASTAKSAFLANMSHEIRTPLNGILGMAQVLAMGPLAPEQSEQVSTILDSGRHLLALLTDILDISKIEAGKLTVTPIETDIIDLLERVGQLWAPKAQEAGLQFHVCVDAALPPVLNFDAGRVRQCLGNLISNAIKFTARGHVVVYASSVRQSSGDHLVKIRVADTGAGINEETLQRLFRPFTQADDTTARTYGGTGLGLSITRKLAELMGGTTTATSQPGCGSEFVLTFLGGEAATKRSSDEREGSDPGHCPSAERGSILMVGAPRRSPKD